MHSCRWPIDWFEEYTTSLADLVVVNSRYTEEVFRRTFARLGGTRLEVLYPTVNFALYDAPLQGDLNDIPLMKTSRVTFLSLNRFERKKDVGLAIKALGTYPVVLIVNKSIWKSRYFRFVLPIWAQRDKCLSCFHC